MSKQITISVAKDYFSLGVISRFQLLRPPMDIGWTLFIEGKSGNSWTLATSRNEVRVFKTLDAAASAIEEIAGRLETFYVTV